MLQLIYYYFSEDIRSKEKNFQLKKLKMQLSTGVDLGLNKVCYGIENKCLREG